MKFSYLFVLAPVLCFSQTESKVEDIAKWKETSRAYIEKYLRKEKSLSWLGEKPESVYLPKIPQVNTDSTSTDVYRLKDNDKNSLFNTLSKEQRLKLDYAYIEELYLVTRKTKASDEDLNKWLNALEQGGTREGVYRAVVHDNVYATIETLPGIVLSEKAMEFTKYFLAVYLAQDLTIESLKTSNPFRAKRIILEKTLDVIDELRKNRSDLNSWYAVLSADLAQKYPSTMKGVTRADKTRKFHRSWAQSTPVDHIKSETLIKIYKIMDIQ